MDVIQSTRLFCVVLVWVVARTLWYKRSLEKSIFVVSCDVIVSYVVWLALGGFSVMNNDNSVVKRIALQEELRLIG